MNRSNKSLCFAAILIRVEADFVGHVARYLSSALGRKDLLRAVECGKRACRPKTTFAGRSSLEPRAEAGRDKRLAIELIAVRQALWTEDEELTSVAYTPRGAL